MSLVELTKARGKRDQIRKRPCSRLIHLALANDQDFWLALMPATSLSTLYLNMSA